MYSSFAAIINTSNTCGTCIQVERLLQEQAAIQAERVRVLTDTCLRHPELATRWNFRIIWDTSRTPPLVYCPVYKVGYVQYILDHHMPYFTSTTKRSTYFVYLPKYQISPCYC